MKLNKCYEGNRQSKRPHSAEQSYNFFADITGQVFETAAATHSQKEGEKHMEMYICICESSREGNEMTGGQ